MDLFDLVSTYVPAKYLPFVLSVWAVLFYAAAPLAKKFGKPGSWLVKAAEWISQDTHRPPAVDAQKSATVTPIK